MKLRKISAIILGLLLCFLFAACDGAQGPDTSSDTSVPVDTLTFGEDMQTDYINWYGRTYHASTVSGVFVNNSASGFEVKFKGTSLIAELRSSSVEDFMFNPELTANRRTYLGISVDGGEYVRKAISQTEKINVTLAENLTEGEHTVKVLKSTEAAAFDLAIFSLETDGSFLAPPAKPALKIEVYGDSITAGYGALKSELGKNEARTTEQEDALSSYGFVAASKLGAQANVFCVSGARLGQYGGGHVIPALHTKTDPFAPATRLWNFENYVADAVIVDLGTNDFVLNAIEPIANFENEFKKQYREFILALREKYPQAAIVMCYGSFSYGGSLVQNYNNMFAQMATDLNTEIGNVYSLALAKCGSGHATKAEHAQYANGLVEVLKTALNIA